MSGGGAEEGVGGVGWIVRVILYLGVFQNSQGVHLVLRGDFTTRCVCLATLEHFFAHAACAKNLF